MGGGGEGVRLAKTALLKLNDQLTYACKTTLSDFARNPTGTENLAVGRLQNIHFMLYIRPIALEGCFTVGVRVL